MNKILSHRNMEYYNWKEYDLLIFHIKYKRISNSWWGLEVKLGTEMRLQLLTHYFEWSVHYLSSIHWYWTLQWKWKEKFIVFFFFWNDSVCLVSWVGQNGCARTRNFRIFKNFITSILTFLKEILWSYWQCLTLA